MSSNEKRRYYQSEAYREACARLSEATDALKLARTKGGKVEIACAEERVAAADRALTKANTQRFEHIAELRATTAARAIEELTKISTQRRYAVTRQHADIIISAIEAALTDLKTTLDAAILRGKDPTIRRRVSFRGEPEDIHAIIREPMPAQDDLPIINYIERGI